MFKPNRDNFFFGNYFTSHKFIADLKKKIAKNYVVTRARGKFTKQHTANTV